MLCHPVLASFITLKWKKVVKYFIFHTTVFLLFLVTYYIYIINAFEYRKSGIESQNVSNSTLDHEEEDIVCDCSNQNQTQNVSKILPSFLCDHSLWVLPNEILFFIMTLLLFGLECYQLYKFKRNYWKQYENLNQIFIIATAVVAMSLKPWILENNKRGQFVRGAIAFGFCITCFEFIFVTGKYPFRGGDFSIMFSRVLSKLSRYVIAMFMIVWGFSCGLNVITFGSGLGFEFETPFKSFVLTLTMAMGEFNAADLYKDFMDVGEYTRVGRTLTLVIVVFMIFSGTIVMINLFVAVIISDTKRLEYEVFKEKLFFMAEGSEFIKDLLPIKWQSGLKVQSSITFCVHKICGQTCKEERVPESIARIVPELQKIAEKNDGQDTRMDSLLQSISELFRKEKL